MSVHGDTKCTVQYTINVGDGNWYVKDVDDQNLPCEFKDYEVTLINARGKPFSVHKEGFFLTKHDTKVTDFYSEEEVKNIYFPEIEEFLHKLFPEASRVFVYDHERRASSKEIRDARKVRPTANYVHNDYSSNSGPKRVRLVFSEEEADNLLKKRFMVINVWRPSVGTVESFPLAFVDTQNVVMEDYLPLQRFAQGRVVEILNVKYSERHKWYYFPKMERNEVAVFKTYDSHVEEGISRFTPHIAARVPVTENTPPRESIEVRAFGFFLKSE